ncbi:SDR family NAD(P)-dependent oxidoreductase [Halomonas sp. M4R1S46]|uniref:SDR family NAD(P)-dependent oxidoreductase n=1 Tax=Halomonas sp. M4R1S46 TaxID=2982692 RepID=UPI0021E47A31|nr:SDR family oxidoreductase [Halomonas sp. M4R1S46]UYG09004.1 SDR family oxidoreductase [Halomonas sp. M4R1S46]
MVHDLEGMNVLVTGATGSIGTAIVKEVARCGGFPLMHYRHNRQAAGTLLEAVNGHGLLVQADLSAREGPKDLWEACIAKAKRIDAVVHNAGVRMEISLESDWDDWHAAWARELQINIQAVADLNRLAIPHFSEHGSGRIISMASRAGQRGYSAEALPYGVTKAALINLSKSVATSFGHLGIVSACIAPGWVRTEMAEAFIAKHGFQAAVADIPIGDIATPQEVAELVGFCLKPSQRSINGATFDMNGGSYIR